MTTTKVKRKKVVSGWAIFVNGKFDIATTNESDAKYFSDITGTSVRNIIPCTIHYQLPPSKKGKK